MLVHFYKVTSSRGILLPVEFYWSCLFKRGLILLVHFYKYSLIKKGFILLSSLLLEDILAARLIKLEQLWGHRSIFF